MEAVRPTTRVVGRALVKHCPVCGQGHLFRRWFTMLERCPRCDLRFERIDGHWVGAWGLNVIVSFTALFLVLVGGFVATYPDFAVVPLLLVAGGTAVLLPLVLFPWSRTVWLAIDLLMRPLEPGEADRPS